MFFHTSPHAAQREYEQRCADAVRKYKLRKAAAAQRGATSARRPLVRAWAQLRARWAGKHRFPVRGLPVMEDHYIA